MSAPAKEAARDAGGVWSSTRANIRERTLRSDRWWQSPLLTVIGLLIFVVYASVRCWIRTAYFVPEHHYLSPFYSPCISTSCVPGSSDFGTPLGDLPLVIPLGFVVLPLLLLFRLTCYYYRKAYYRSFWGSPPACAVAEPHRGYRGESRMPLIVQNSHRYFFFIALAVTVINSYDAVVAFQGANGSPGFGLGNIIMVVNVIMLWVYTLSCHSCRHVTGGRLRHFSRHPVRYRLWTWVSRINTRHMEWAWITLATLIITDLYIMLVSSGTFSDPRFIN